MSDQPQPEESAPTAEQKAPEVKPDTSAPATDTTPPSTQEDVTKDGSKGAVPESNQEDELKRVTEERDSFRQRLEAAEAELARLRAAGGGSEVRGDGGEGDNAKLLEDNQKLRATLRKATDLLREKVTMSVSQEKRNRALVQQVDSLKEVLAVTKDLLNIRNMEVEQLQKNLDSMEKRVDENRRNQNHLITQMENATKINKALKNEYETQLKIFQQLKERYEEKVQALTHINALRAEGTEVFVDAQEQITPSQS